MAVDMFLKLGDKIKGESKDSMHKQEIDILAWSWGLSQTGSFHEGGGGGAGRANFQDITVTKYVDSSSHALMDHIANGNEIPKAILACRKAGGKKPLEYLIITMEKVMITSLSTGGSQGQEKLTENVAINFAKVKVDYIEQKADGSGGPKKTFTYNIQERKK